MKKFAVLFRYGLQMHRKSDKGEEVSRNECRREAVTVDGGISEPDIFRLLQDDRGLFRSAGPGTGYVSVGVPASCGCSAGSGEEMAVPDRSEPLH